MYFDYFVPGWTVVGENMKSKNDSVFKVALFICKIWNKYDQINSS